MKQMGRWVLKVWLTENRIDPCWAKWRQGIGVCSIVEWHFDWSCTFRSRMVKLGLLLGANVIHEKMTEVKVREANMQMYIGSI